MMSVPCLIALIVLVAIIAVGIRLNINLGVLGLVAAYICGSVIGGIPAGNILGMWPISVMTQVICIMLFFGVAMTNGTFKAVADKIIYAGRGFSPLMPFLLYLSILLVALVGTGSTAVYIMALPIYLIAKDIKMKPGFIPIIVIAGLNAGSWQIFSRDGAVASGIMANAGFTSQQATEIGTKLGLHYLLTSLLLFAVGYVIFQGWKCQALVTDKPAPFTRDQRVTLILVATFVIIYMVPTILGNFIDSAALDFINARLNLFTLACVFTLLCLILKLSDMKQMLDTVPWMALITVGGMGTFIKVCTELGVVDVLSSFISNNVDPAWVPSVLALSAGCMSLFTATISVVLPTFYPIAFSLAETMSISPALMVSALTIGSGMAGISPFSTMGAVTYSVIGEEDKQKVFVSEIFTVLLAFALVQVCILIGLYNI